MPLRRLRNETSSLLPVPMYHQIYLVLREQLAEGRFRPEEPLPSEFELAAHFGVSRVTLRGALEKLQQEHLIVRQRGRGTFPLRIARPAPLTGDLSGLLDNLVAVGERTTVQVLEHEPALPPTDIARAFGVDAADLLFRTVRVRSLRGAPVGHLTTYVRPELGSVLSRRDLEAQPMLTLIEQAGTRVARATQTITARLADGEVARALAVDLGAALIALARTVHDADGRVVQMLRGLYRPDRYQLAMQLARTRSDATRVWIGDPGRSSHQAVAADPRD